MTRPPMATPRMASGALIRDGIGGVLLVRPTYKPGWEIPGGYVEPGESPAAACARELVEEIGWHRPIADLLVVDWAPHPHEGDKLLFVFDGGLLPAADAGLLIPDGAEISQISFHPASALHALMPDRLTRRVALALDAVHEGRTIYAEHGHRYPPTTERR